MNEPLKISHSRAELFQGCAFKYKLKYIDGWDADITYSPLLFGGAVDQALNYILESVRDKVPYDITKAKQIFVDTMNAGWSGQNELSFFKSEIEPSEYVEGDFEGNQYRAFAYLSGIGQKMLDAYVENVLPMFKEVIDVQVKRQIVNESGDTLTLIMDAIVRLNDGRICVADNKTAGNPRKSYPKNSVQKSPQLSLYSEFVDSSTAAYIVLGKKVTDTGDIDLHIVIDEIPEATTVATFAKIENTLSEMKTGEFPKNFKNCFSFGRKCEFYEKCRGGGSDAGLIKRK